MQPVALPSSAAGPRWLLWLAARPRLVLALYALLTALVTAQHLAHDTFNNYRLYTRPFFNLLAGRNIYLEYPALYHDTYKYSPTFALLIGPFASLPDWAGLALWNALNTSVLLLAVRRFWRSAGPPPRTALFLFFILADFLTALHNSQANALLLGLLLLTYLNLEAGQSRWAALCVALAFFIKIYGIGLGLLFLLYPRPVRAGLWAALWVAALTALPLLVVSPASLLMQYRGWLAVVGASATGTQLSVMGVLEGWFGLPLLPNKAYVQALGLLLLLGPLVHWRHWGAWAYRRLYLSSVLIFVVIFNQMAEPATYVLPVAGFGLWFFTFRRTVPPALAWALFGLVVLSSLSAGDLLPAALREKYFDPYKLKAVPLILAWALIHLGQLSFYPRWADRLTTCRSFPLAGS